MSIVKKQDQSYLTETLPTDDVKMLLGQGGTAAELRDRLIEVAGDRQKLVRLMGALRK